MIFSGFPVRLLPTLGSLFRGLCRSCFRFVFCGPVGVCSALSFAVLLPGVGAYDDKGLVGLFGSAAEVSLPFGKGFDSIHKESCLAQF